MEGRAGCAYSCRLGKRGSVSRALGEERERDGWMVQLLLFGRGGAQGAIVGFFLHVGGMSRLSYFLRLTTFSLCFLSFVRAMIPSLLECALSLSLSLSLLREFSLSQIVGTRSTLCLTVTSDG